MTTSGTSSFNLDLSEIIEEAFERCGSELRSGYDHRTARRSLNLLFADWANRGINMWTIEQGTINLVQGTNTYDLPIDTVDLIEHQIRTGAGNQYTQADLTITRISVDTYTTIPNKLAQGRPIQVWFNRQTGQTNSTAVTLTSSITSSSTSIVLTDGSSFSASNGTVSIDAELIFYTTRTTNTLSGLTRGYNGSRAAAHTSGATVTQITSAFSGWGVSSTTGGVGQQLRLWSQANFRQRLSTGYGWKRNSIFTKYPSIKTKTISGWWFCV